VLITKGHDFRYLGRRPQNVYNVHRSSFISALEPNMIAGATLILTVISALGIGVAAGWAVLTAILYAFSRRTHAKAKAA
jgi:hypothetical protein